jgi:GntR family phosphonate transport system transcriptional regulator
MLDEDETGIARGSWRDVAARLTTELEAGRWKPGDCLPVEAELCDWLGVGRHSLRRAISALASSGQLRVQQGAGTFVAQQVRLTYAIGARTRFSDIVRANGHTPSSQILSAETVDAPDAITAVLGQSGQMHRIMALGLADEVPVCLTTGWYPAARFPDLSQRRCKQETISAIYASHGAADYERRDTAISARPAGPHEARHLGLTLDRPVLVSCKVDTDRNHIAIGYSEAIWAAERVQFNIANPGNEIRE